MNNPTHFFLSFIFLVISFNPIHAQEDYSDDVKQYISHKKGKYLLQNAILIDGTGNAVKSGQDIFINEGRIEAVGIDLPITEGATIIDLTDKSVIPGLIMMHEHLFYPDAVDDGRFGLSQMSYSFPRLYLAGGVTTMRTAGGINPQTDINLKREIANGITPGPDIDVTTQHIDREGTGILEMSYINSTEDAVNVVKFWAARGATSVKVYNFITREDLKAIVETAHALGMKVTGHLCSITYKEAADLGIDNLEHGFFASSDFQKGKKPDICYPFEARKARLDMAVNNEVVPPLIDHLIEKNVALTSTINVFEPYTGREVVPGGGIDALYTDAKEKVYKRWSGKQGRDSIDHHAFTQAKVWEKAFYDAGGLLLAGTDPTYDGRIVAGYANQRLLELLVEMGLSIPEAVKVCSLHGAKYLGIEGQTGTIAPNMDADLLIINGDISKDIGQIRNLETVFKHGVGFDSKKLFKSAEGLVGIR